MNMQSVAIDGIDGADDTLRNAPKILRFFFTLHR